MRQMTLAVLPLSPARRRPAVLVVLLALLVFTTFAARASAAGPAYPWTQNGASPADNRAQPLDFQVNPLNAFLLKPKWTFTTHGDVSATPTVSGGVVYFPDWGGYINAVNSSTGALIWQRTVASYEGAGTGTGAVISRTSPVIDGNEIIFGDDITGLHTSGAHIFAVNAATGDLIWSTQVDANPNAIITGSPALGAGRLIVPVSSIEETSALSTTYDCCTFRGSVVSLDPTTGAVQWQTYDMPPATPCTSLNPPAGCSYTGGAIWDTPAIDESTGEMYIGTGNNYTATDAAQQCQIADPTATDCTAADDEFDAILAINLSTGHIDWDHKLEGWDAFTLACPVGSPGKNWCPDPDGPDYDVSSGPNLMQIGGETVVGVGQKSGVYWAFDATTGDLLWDKSDGPGGSLGGMAWGTAYDGVRIYVHESDAYHVAYTLANGQTAEGGSWSALNPATGATEWQTATPLGAAAMGPPSEAGGVVYAGSTAPAGDNMFALSARTGRILWRFASGGSVNSGPAISGNTVYWGSGYSEFGFLGYTGNDKFYAFTVGGT